ncbi:hypothetical protein 1013_scaffold3125_00153 [Bacteriophage sp.]|nr:hypothetical protein 1013_scaffold3125_00153 [Bacteriophage sp.]
MRGCFYHRIQLSKKEKGLTTQPSIYSFFFRYYLYCLCDFVVSLFSF